MDYDNEKDGLKFQVYYDDVAGHNAVVAAVPAKGEWDEKSKEKFADTLKVLERVAESPEVNDAIRAKLPHHYHLKDPMDSITELSWGDGSVVRAHGMKLEVSGFKTEQDAEAVVAVMEKALKKELGAEKPKSKVEQLGRKEPRYTPGNTNLNEYTGGKIENMLDNRTDRKMLMARIMSDSQLIPEDRLQLAQQLMEAAVEKAQEQTKVPARR